MRTSTPLPVLEALRERIQRLEGGGPRRKTVLPFGIKAIDQHLPEGGLALGALHEVAGGGMGRSMARPLRSSPPELRRAQEVGCCGVSPGRISSRPPSPRPVSCPTASSMWRRAMRRRCSPVSRKGCGTWRSCRRGGASVHDGVAPSSTCRGRFRRYRHRCSPLAPTERYRRFRAADGFRHALARQPAALNPLAGSGRRTRPMAA
jgi:hypothetical protein